MDKKDTLEKLKMLNSLMEDFLDMMEIDDSEDDSDEEQDPNEEEK